MVSFEALSSPVILMREDATWRCNGPTNDMWIHRCTRDQKLLT